RRRHRGHSSGAIRCRCLEPEAECPGQFGEGHALARGVDHADGIIHILTRLRCFSTAKCDWKNATAREDLSHNSRPRKAEVAGRITSGNCITSCDMLCQTFCLTHE